jgi:CRP-like cAMP-binding protein
VILGSPPLGSRTVAPMRGQGNLDRIVNSRVTGTPRRRITRALGVVRAEADLVDQLFNSSEKRLARALLILAHYGKEGAPETMVAKISQETLAELVGTTRSRVNFFMNKFRKMGFIHYNGGLQVHSSLLNVVLHDQ